MKLPRINKIKTNESNLANYFHFEYCTVHYMHIFPFPGTSPGNTRVSPGLH